MRKLFILLLLLITVNLFGDEIDRVARDNIHMREGPGCFYPVIMVLNKGAEIEIDKRAKDWLNVYCSDEKGWIFNNALKPAPAENNIFGNQLDASKDHTISQASVSAAVRGFAQKYLSNTDGDTAFLNNFDHMIITPQMYQSFKDETYRNRDHKMIKKRYKDWKDFKYTGDFHITYYLEKTGFAVATRIARKGVIDDQAKLQYINNVGTLITEHSELNYYPIKYYIIKDQRPAAYATPIGMIFITEGLFKMVKNEAELACLLGHELGHVVRQHGYREIKKRKPRIAAQKAFQELDESIPGTDTTAVALSRLANNMYEAATAKRQLKYEYQADKCGAVYAYRAGYDPAALVDLLTRIKDNSETDYVNFESNWEAYYIKDRIERLEKFINKELQRRKHLNVDNRYRFENTILNK